MASNIPTSEIQISPRESAPFKKSSMATTPVYISTREKCSFQGIELSRSVEIYSIDSFNAAANIPSNELDEMFGGTEIRRKWKRDLASNAIASATLAPLTLDRFPQPKRCTGSLFRFRCSD
ncbi:hypothetical protein WDU94_010783 [Cyamophila willieti]